MNNKVIVLILLASLASCQGTDQQNPKDYPILIEINKDNLPEEMPLSEAVKSVRLLALETKESCFFDRISQVNQVGGKIFILPYTKTNGVLVFDQQGKYLYNFGKVGKGPGEFSELIGFSFSKDLKTIYLVSYNDKKLCAYSLDGDFLNDISLPAYLCDLEFIGKDDYVAINNRSHYFKFGNVQTGIYRDTIKWTSGQMSVGGKLFYKSELGHFNYSSTLMDTIYAIDAEDVYARYCFDFGSQSCSADELRNAMEKNRYYPPNKYFLEYPYLETSDYLYFGLMRQKESKYYGKDMIRMDRKSGDLIRFKDDIVFRNSHYATAITYNNEMVSAISPAYMGEATDKILSNQDFDYPEGFKDIIKEMEEEDNPLLLFFTFR